MILNKKTIFSSILLGLLSLGAQAAGKTYTEDEFLKSFKIVTKKSNIEE